MKTVKMKGAKLFPQLSNLLHLSSEARWWWGYAPGILPWYSFSAKSLVRGDMQVVWKHAACIQYHRWKGHFSHFIPVISAISCWQHAASYHRMCTPARLAYFVSACARGKQREEAYYWTLCNRTCTEICYVMHAPLWCMPHHWVLKLCSFPSFIV